MNGKIKKLTLLTQVLLTGVLLGLLSFHCASTDPEDDIFYIDPRAMFLFLYSYEETNLFIDHNDGTITVQRYKGGVNLMYGVTLKKCLEGQTYRAAGNDCQGSGNVGNYYGAINLQYCSVNDNTCNSLTGYLNNLGSSAAYNSCAAETLNAKTWRVVPRDRFAEIIEDAQFALFFPEAVGATIMTNEPVTPSRYRVYQYTQSPRDFLKTQSAQVLCAVEE